MHQQRVNQMIKSAEGSVGLLHKITKPTARRGGAQDPVKRRRGCQVCWTVVKERGKTGQKHWLCGEDVQNVEEKPWKNEELRKLEESLPR